jgi:hypothetical protein
VLDDIFQLIDQSAVDFTADMGLVVDSLEGVYARVYRAQPSVRGLDQFLSETDNLAAAAARLAEDSFHKFQERTPFLRTAFNPENPGNPQTLSLAVSQIHSMTHGLRLQAARRFRAAIVSRRSVAPPRSGLRVLNRAGQSFDAREMFFLVGRKAMLDLYNESQIDGLKFEGHQTAQVIHRNPNHALHGSLFAIGDIAGDLPHYMEIQNKWFHPRSNAVVGRSN